jgi:hypothetical protein
LANRTTKHDKIAAKFFKKMAKSLLILSYKLYEVPALMASVSLGWIIYEVPILIQKLLMLFSV